MEKKIRAAVAGAVSVDICPVFTCGQVTDFSDIIKPSLITHIEGNEIHPGGPVANTGIAMSMFGISPVLLAAVGNDDLGRMLLSMLEKNTGPDPVRSIISTDDYHTAYSIILSAPGLDRAILQNPGANDGFCFENMDFDSLSECRLLHFGHPSTMKKIYENGGDDLVRILSESRSRGMLTSLDLCAVDPHSEAGKQDWHHILARVLPYVDFFVPSIGELSEILYPDESNVSPEDLCRLSHSLGASNILIKNGIDGMYFSNSGKATFSDIEKRAGLPGGSMSSWAGRSGHVPARAAQKEVSGLGAGDTSVAAYLSAMLRGFSFERCLDLAVTEGALCVTQASATGGLRPFEEL